MRTLFSFLLLQFFILTAAAHDVRGRAVTADGQPLAYAVVASSSPSADSAKGAVRQCVAGKDGNFVLRGLDDGTYNITIRHIGYQTFEKPVEVGGRKVEMGDCMLDVTPVQLGEVIAFADGMTMEQYILQSMQKHGRKLKEVCPDYTCDAKFTMNQDFDYSVYPKTARNIILTACTLTGRRASCLFMMNHPVIDVTVESQVTSRSGKVKAGKGYVTHSNFELSDKDNDGLMQMVTFFPELYDAFNDPQSGTLGRKRNKDLTKTTWVYKGSYEENGRTIYVLENEYAHVEVVKDLWCVRACRCVSGIENNTYNEYIFEEVSDGAFLPVAFVQKMKMLTMDDTEVTAQEWEEMKSESHGNPERQQAIEDMQQRFARGEKGADIILLITYKYE